MEEIVNAEYTELVFLQEDKTHGKILGKCISELLGTATIMFIGCMGCMPDLVSGAEIPSSFAPLSFGLAVACSVQMYGHISGGHFNPCVTVAALIMKKIQLNLSIFYAISQLIGAIIGYGLLMLVTNKSINSGVCLTAINPKIEIYQGFIIEFVITGMLISLCCAVWDERLSGNTDSVAIRFGLTLGSIFIATAQFTGSSINPVRSFAPALLQMEWANHWVYWTAPPLGSIVTATFYRFVFVEGLLNMGAIKSRTVK